MELQQKLGQAADVPHIRVGRDARGSTVWEVVQVAAGADEVVVQVATGAHAVEVCEALRRALQPPEME